MKNILTFDIGGTKIAYSLLNEQGEFVGDIHKIPTPNSANEIVSLFKKVIEENYDQIEGVAFSTAGAVNNQETKVISANGNLPQGYAEIDFVGLTNKPVLVENDANSAAWAEYSLGAAKGCSHAIVLAIGTGIGSGIIIDGKLLKGKSGAAGEMHFPIDSGHKRKCKCCGLYDCFESFASGTGLQTSARLVMGDNATTYDVIEEVGKNNPVAKKVFAEWQNYLINGMIMLGNIFDPEIIVLSGSMAQFVEYPKLETEVNNALLTQPLKICPAKFENNAGMLGVGMLLWDKLNA